MKKIAHILILLISVVAISCDDQSIDMGTVTYYPSFLWSDADTVPLLKSFEFEFSEDAKAVQTVFAEFAFVNNEGKPITPEELLVYVDGVELKDNTFRVTSADSKKEIKYIFPSTAESGKHQGYLKLINHNLHRIGNEQLTPGQTVDVFQWTIYFDKRMNPFAKALVWIGIVLAAALFVWILIGRKIVYPRFRAINKYVIIPNQVPISIRFKGARMVVLDSKKHKQTWYNKWLTGKIIYKCHPALNSPITLMPRDRGRKILFKANPAYYSCSPNPIGIAPSIVIDNKSKENIKIQ